MGLFSSKSAVLTAPAPMVPSVVVSPSPAPSVPAPAAVSRTMSISAPSQPLPPPPQSERSIYLQQLKVRIHQQLVQRLDVQNLRVLPPETVRGEVRVLIRELCQSEKGLINSADQERLMDEVMDETFGLGPLESLLKDPTISDILVNRCDRIYVERKGRIELSETALPR